MEATHAQSITGFGIVKLTDTLNFPLHNTIYGSYYQTGTPIPDALCDISFVEGKLPTVSKNLYDISGCPEGGGLRTYSLQFNLYKGTQFITGVTNEGPLSNSYINTGLYPT